MKLLERVLVAIDFNAASQHVLETAERLGEAFNSELILLHVLPSVEDKTAGSVLAMAREGAMQRLAEFRDRLAQSGRAVREPIVSEGIPFHQIIGVAEDLNVNVILVGSRESGTASDGTRQLGKTAERLCRKADKPVWILRHGKPFEGRSVLCPVDASSASRRALRNAIHLARKMQARLHVLHVTEPLSTLSRLFQGESASDSSHQDAEVRRFDELIGQFDFTGVDWKRLVREGQAGGEILAACEETEADLVVMGSTGESGLARILLGGVAADVARRSPCSLVLLKGEDAIRVKLNEEITDVASSFAEGRELLEQGFVEDARRRFEHCVRANDFFIPAWNALAEVHERLGDEERAAECRNTAQRVEDLLYWKKVEADIRGKHPLWKKGGRAGS